MLTRRVKSGESVSGVGPFMNPMIRLLAFFLLFLAAAPAWAKGGVLYVLDASGSMNSIEQLKCSKSGCPHGPTLFSQALRRLHAELSANQFLNTPAGLIAFSHRGGGCDDIEVVTTVTTYGAARILSFVETVQARGPTPLAAALEQANKTLESAPSGTRVVILSDGFESCNGDPVLAAKALKAAHPGSGIDIIFVGNATSEQRRALQEVSEAGGGSFSETGGAGVGPRKNISSVFYSTAAQSKGTSGKSAGVSPLQESASIDINSSPDVLDFSSPIKNEPDSVPAIPEPKASPKIDQKLSDDPAPRAQTPLLL